jgi:glycosidase
MEKHKMEFHISKLARDKYQFEQSLFELDGTIAIGNFNAAKLLASKMNEKKDLLNFPESAAKASEIYAIGLIDEIFHHVFNLYKKTIKENIFQEAVEYLTQNLTSQEINQVIQLFVKEFPPQKVYLKEQSITDYINEIFKNQSYFLQIEEIIMLWVENLNPALEPYNEFFFDKELENNSQYNKFMELLNDFFELQPHFGPENLNIIQMLRTPSIVAPNSLHQQLEYIRTHWANLLGDLLYKLIRGIDFINEEFKPSFTGPGEFRVPGYKEIWDLDQEKFSPDKDWMPSLVLIAKNTYVWLDQMRNKYKLPIYTLDNIPDQELEIIKERGFNGLWLIGLWERSEASAKIKQLCGNPEAIASAYSLAGYNIAHELGGEEAYQKFKDKAWKKGIRLAADMVPNHMGIDSNWVYEHPDWFVQLDHSPFPSYSFTGTNLSKYSDFEIKIEDHYYDRSDAAVVFLMKNNYTGETRFMYHGNDGTTMPWNDTAQLNYLIQDVREAVYQTILSVAKRFPIIRFDAAMTLAKKHYQRLWFPEPGGGGAIPSRAEFGLTKSQFDLLMPNEFWREVVDRLAVDAPDTLLLAEAFWLMESFFVRTLGMHRVYNSAFMNMLRNEDNANYRQLIKKTIEFDPQILKRFVNFMNNPDEKTAVDQFGKGDKYFGICILMSTLPGLPMFGHGQFEGFSEKYGMEYKKAYWDEKEDQNLINRHKQLVSPLLHRRNIFSEVTNFLLYDFQTRDNFVNEEVYAYSNFNHKKASLVIYNNKFANTQGFIKESATRILLNENGKSAYRTVNLGEGLHLNRDFDYVIFQDITSKLEYIRSVNEIYQNGMFFDLHAYQSHVMIDFRLIKDDQWQTYKRLHEYLQGKGVPNITEAMSELMMLPLHKPLKEILNRGFFDFLYSQRIMSSKDILKPKIKLETQTKLENLFVGINEILENSTNEDKIAKKIQKSLEFLLSIPIFDKKFVSLKNKNLKKFVANFQEKLSKNDEGWIVSLIYTFLHPIGEIFETNNTAFQNQSLFEEWNIAKIIRELGNSYQLSELQLNNLVQITYMLIGLSDWYQSYSENQFDIWWKQLLSKKDVQDFIEVNRYKEKLWFNKEKFESFVSWLISIAMIQIGSQPTTSTNTLIESFIRLQALETLLLERMKKSEYQFTNLVIE